jgi:hypothetical protein
VARVRGQRRKALMTASAVSAYRREMNSLEHFCLKWPWHELRNAASLACDLIRWATPATRWADADAPEVVELDRRNDAEVPVGGDPYRSVGDQRVCIDSTEVSDARFEIMYTLSWISMFAENQPIVAPLDFGSPDEDPRTRIYWYAAELGKRTMTACELAAASVTDEKLASRWHVVGFSTDEATEFLRKFASTGHLTEGAAGNILNRIGTNLTVLGIPVEDITGQMFHWRVKDALKGKELSAEMTANLRPAFEAAWAAGEYDFAYSLLDDLDQFVE